jgi:hypothetical protein
MAHGAWGMEPEVRGQKSEGRVQRAGHGEEGVQDDDPGMPRGRR